MYLEPSKEDSEPIPEGRQKNAEKIDQALISTVEEKLKIAEKLHSSQEIQIRNLHATLEELTDLAEDLLAYKECQKKAQDKKASQEQSRSPEITKKKAVRNKLH